jgi:hypothetical protein
MWSIKINLNIMIINVKTWQIVEYKELVTFFAGCWFKVDYSYCYNFRKSLIFLA